jgi:hypothetical protein
VEIDSLKIKIEIKIKIKIETKKIKTRKNFFGRRPAADPATNNWNSSGARPRNCCLCHQIVAYVIIFPKKFFKANFEVSG